VAAHILAQDTVFVNDAAVSLGPHILIVKARRPALHVMMGTEERIKQLVAIPWIIDRLIEIGPPNVIGASHMSIIRSTREVKQNGPTLIPEIKP
jgi:hypothetical protein